MTSRISRPRCLVAALAICGLGLVAQGCNIVAPILFLVVGPDKIPAQHRLDDERTTVILVEDPRNLMPRRAARIALLEAAEDEIINRGLVDTVVSGQSAMRLADADEADTGLSVTEIGRRMEAGVVVWVTIDSFARIDTSRNVEPSVGMRVRVVDADANEILFPDPASAVPSGYPVVVRESVRQGTVANSGGAQASAELQIADKAGRAVAQLFYTHPVTQRIADRGL